MSEALFFSHVTLPSIRRHRTPNLHRCSLKPPGSRPLSHIRFTSSFIRVWRTNPSSETSGTKSAHRHSYSNIFCIKEEHKVRSYSTENSSTLQPADKEQYANNRFDWFNQWYPVALVADLYEGKPNAAKVLGTDIVVWKVPEKDTWTVFHDRCPHRFAALSKGRINQTTRTLECGYHGWQFNSKGKCSVIPQEEKAPSGLACATKLPSLAQSGMLFVWMGNSEPPPDSRPHVIDDVRAKYITSTYSRILPLCFTTLIQNVLDPAHIHFAHHGQIGHRELAAPIPIRILKSQTSQGFIADYHDGAVRLRFRPPCLIEIVTSNGLSFAYYAVPLSSGVVLTFALRGTSRRPLFRIPKWLDHIQRNRLVEGDLELMISQQREMRKVAKTNNYAASWAHFYMPTSSDRLVLEMKRWLHQNAPTHSCDWFKFCEDENVDGYKSRLSSHTKGCSSCSNLRSRLILSERTAASLAVGAILRGLTTSNETKVVWSCLVGFCWFLFVVSRGLRKRLE